MLESTVSTAVQMQGAKLEGFVEAVVGSICVQCRRYLEARHIYGGLCAIVGGMTVSQRVRNRVEEVFREISREHGNEGVVAKAIRVAVQHCTALGAVRAAAAGVTLIHPI